MPKYYVESGSNLLVTTTAVNETEAIVKALKTVVNQQPLQLADMIIVNERGFVWNREDHELNGDEFIVPTSLLLGEPEEKDEFAS